MRKTDTGFSQDNVGFDLLQEADIQKPPGIVLV